MRKERLRLPKHASNALLQIVNGYDDDSGKRGRREVERRKNNEDKLKISAGNLTPPHWLSPGAKKEFNHIVELFGETELLTEADTNTLAQYCDLLGEYKSCNTRPKKYGRAPDGKTNPDIKLKLSISQAMQRLVKDLGLSPAARASLAINMRDDGEDEEDF